MRILWLALGFSGAIITGILCVLLYTQFKVDPNNVMITAIVFGAIITGYAIKKVSEMTEEHNDVLHDR